MSSAILRRPAILAWKFHRAKALVKFSGSGFDDARDDSQFDGLPLVPSKQER
jgi:hypothetical protein